MISSLPHYESTPSKHKPPKHQNRWRKRCLLFAGAAGGLLMLVSGVRLLSSFASAAGGFSVVGLMMAALDRVRGLGAWSVPMLFACEAACFLLLLPISPLHVGIGFLWGAWYGCLLAWACYAVGCVPPFLLTRVPCLTERFKILRRRAELLDGVFLAVETEPFKLIVCLRLSPLLPSTLNSYLLGLTNVPLKTYLLASLVGSLPNVGAYVYLGTLLDSLADIAAGRVQRSPLSMALLITGLVATVAMLAYVSRVATRRVHAAQRQKSAAHVLGSPLGEDRL